MDAFTRSQLLALCEVFYRAQAEAFDAMKALDLKVEFLRDLGDAILNDGLKAAKGPGFETYVDTMFKTQLRLAQSRKLYIPGENPLAFVADIGALHFSGDEESLQVT